MNVFFYAKCVSNSIFVRWNECFPSIWTMNAIHSNHNSVPLNYWTDRIQHVMAATCGIIVESIISRMSTIGGHKLPFTRTGWFFLITLVWIASLPLASYRCISHLLVAHESTHQMGLINDEHSWNKDLGSVIWLMNWSAGEICSITLKAVIVYSTLFKYKPRWCFEKVLWAHHRISWEAVQRWLAWKTLWSIGYSWDMVSLDMAYETSNHKLVRFLGAITVRHKSMFLC